MADDDVDVVIVGSGFTVAVKNPQENDEQVFRVARMVNNALMAKTLRQ
jgi:hypothetical protein